MSALFLMTACTGSPPRMRGKRAFLNDFAILNRITPADAGKTNGAQQEINHFQDHPRGCGENVIKVPIRNGSPGSPPRMRGKLIIISGIVT